MTNEERIINNIASQHEVIDKAVKKMADQEKEHQVRCRKCGNIIKLDVGEEGICQYCV